MRYYAAFFALLLIAFSSSISLACEEPPLPLRGMYLESDLIVVGKIGKPGKWIAGKNEAASDYLIFNRSYPISVEKTLKGDAHGKLSVWEENYHYLGEGENGAKVTEPNGTEFVSELGKDSGRRLFFLKKGEDGHYAEIYSNRYEFSPQGKDLDVYIARIGELNDMYKNGATPSKETIVEWLVSMAENSVTRFEGAYELRESVYDLKWKLEQEAEEAAKAKEHAHSVKEEMAKNEVVIAVDETAETSGEGEDHESYPVYGEADFAKLLTQGQKDRLVKAFFTAKFNYEPKKYKDAEDPNETYVEALNEGDRHLAETVIQFGDRRVINRLMAEVPSLVKHQPYMAADFINEIAGVLRNERLKTLAEKFSDVAYGGENEMIEAKANAYDLDSGLSEADRNAQLATLPGKTYGTRRAELLEQINASMNQLMAKK